MIINLLNVYVCKDSFEDKTLMLVFSICLIFIFLFFFKILNLEYTKIFFFKKSSLRSIYLNQIIHETH